MLDFWGSWCPPCVSSIPDLKRIQKKFAKDPVVILGIADPGGATPTTADEKEKAWRKFLADNKMDWPEYYDRDGRIARLFGVHRFPSYIVINGEGIITNGFVGATAVPSVTVYAPAGTGGRFDTISTILFEARAWSQARQYGPGDIEDAIKKALKTLPAGKTKAAGGA